MLQQIQEHGASLTNSLWLHNALHSTKKRLPNCEGDVTAILAAGQSVCWN